LVFKEKSTDKEIMNSILDVEDLVKTGKKQRWGSACCFKGFDQSTERNSVFALLMQHLTWLHWESFLWVFVN